MTTAHDFGGNANAHIAYLQRKLSIAQTALQNIQKNCCRNRSRGFDYGEKHPTLGINPVGRWLTPKEIAGIALREIS